MAATVGVIWKLSSRCDSCSGMRSAVAMILRRGVATVTMTGRGLMMCCRLFFCDAAGVGG